MTRGTINLLLLACAWQSLANPCLAEVGDVGHRDGTAGNLSHLGDDVAIYSDAHGNTAPVIHPALQSPGPHGDVSTGALTPFGTPSPPNGVTPAPLLPFSPNRPLSPQQSVAPSLSAPPQGFGPSGGGGRFGR